MMTVLLASSRNILQTVAQGSLMQAPVNSLFFWKTVAELSIKAHFRLIMEPMPQIYPQFCDDLGTLHQRSAAVT